MKRPYQFGIIATFLVSAAILIPNVASACAACFGRSDDAMAHGMNMGIIALLVVVTGVLAGIAGVGIFFAVRAARLAKAGVSPTEPAASNLTHSQ